MTRLNIRGLAALFLTVLTLGLGQVPASAQMIGRVPYLSPNPCKGVTLSLGFARSTGPYCLNGSRYGSVTNIPGWTYTGGTPAGTGSYAPKADGSLQFFPSYTNLLLQSQTFDDAAWTKTATTVTANAVAAPDGTLTADKLAETATTALHYTLCNVSISASATYTVSVFLKAAERNTAVIWLANAATGDRAQADVTLTGSGSATVGGQGGAPFTGVSSTISALDNGWYRVSVTGTTTGGAISLQTRIYANNQTSYAGTAGSGIYIWGAQLELGSTASTYIPTTTAAVTVAPPRITDAGYLAEEARTNLLLRSQEFDNAAWTQTNVSTLANQLVAPDGTMTADKLNETAGTGVHSTYQDITKAASAIAYALCVYAKSGERNSIELSLQSGSSGAFARVNLDTGSLIANSGYGAAAFTSVSTTITAAPNGFWRVCLMATTDTSTTLRSVVGNYFGGSSYAGTAGSGIYIWQADLQAGSFATSPIPTTSVAVTRSADVGYISGLTVPSALTLRADFSRTAAASTNFNSPASIGVFNTVGNEIYITRHSSTAVRGYVVSSSTNKEVMVATVSAGQDAISAAIRAEVSNGNGALGGTLSPGSDTAAVVMPIGANSLYVGSRNVPNTTMNGTIRRIVIYPRAMSNSELQAVTIGPVSFANDNAPDDMRAALWGWAA